MKFRAPREALLAPLQAVVGVVEKRQTMPILGNFLLSAADKVLSVTATDLEVELMAEREMITRLEDFLRRRTKLSLVMHRDELGADPGMAEVNRILGLTASSS